MSHDSKSAEHILIIGGNKGLGLAIKELLISQAWDNEPWRPSPKIVCMNRHSEETPLDLTWDGHKIVREVRTVVRGELEGYVDKFICSSGDGKYNNPIGDPDAVTRTMKVNLEGPIHAYRGAFKGLIKTKGKACFITSTCSRKPGSGGLSLYGTSKAGLNGYVINEGRRAARAGVALFAVAPGWFHSEMTEGMNGKPSYASAVKAIPFGRFGEADEIADFVVSLLGRSNWCLAGNVIECAGGA